MANPPKSESYSKILVNTSRAIVTYQVGLPFGCIRIRRIIRDLRPYKELAYPVFDEYLKSLAGLPIGSERLKWNRDALRASDKKLEAESGKFRDAIFEACYQIIDSNGGQSNSK